MGKQNKPHNAFVHLISFIRSIAFLISMYSAEANHTVEEDLSALPGTNHTNPHGDKADEAERVGGIAGLASCITVVIFFFIMIYCKNPCRREPFEALASSEASEDRDEEDEKDDESPPSVEQTTPLSDNEHSS